MWVKRMGAAGLEGPRLMLQLVLDVPFFVTVLSGVLRFRPFFGVSEVTALKSKAQQTLGLSLTETVWFWQGSLSEVDFSIVKFA